ncbi:hypothetical protein B0H16DRAFT_1014590 [Mycena metata]|uniref:F-box domain-containing protein n=1 Tax=Mycena metata TaxID=1033252 RepID=A0AAD7IHA3_9AGAR|nr:hypothetical protein B0H16DRAFT_1014590 [Mycena metata]
MSTSIDSSAIGSAGLVDLETQVNSVKALIETTEGNIARLTTQINELTCLRAEECRVVARLRALIAPIGRLPTELLVEIFMMVVETPIFNSSAIRVVRESLYSADSSAALGKVLCLSQVSPHWRQIICGTPRLWGEGVISVPLNRGIKERDNALFIRSTPCPISVSLTYSANEDTKSSKATARLVMSTAQRWKNLDIDLPSFSDFDDFPPDIFDALERLHVNNLSKQTSPIVIFHSSPRLRQFGFTTACAKPSKIALFHLPWEQLTHLTVRDRSLRGCRTILLLCSNLISAQFDTTFEWDQTPETMPIVTLPFLKTFSISIWDFIGDPVHNHGVEAFFAVLAFPSLVTLDLTFDSEADVMGPREIFSEFLRRSPKIKEFSLIDDCWFDSEGLIVLLRLTPALTKLSIEARSQCLNTEFLEALRYDNADASPLTPSLQVLSLETDGRVDEPSFEAVIRSRWWSDDKGFLPSGSPKRVSRLKRAEISTPNSFSKEFNARMEDLEDEGLELLLFG